MNFDDLEGKNSIHWIRYEKSKLAQIYFTYELQRRLDEQNSKVTVNCVHPGIIATEIVSYLPFGLHHVYQFLGGLLGLTAEKGAKGPAFVVTSLSVDGIGGKYFSLWNPSQSSLISYNKEIAKKLWSVSEKQVGLA